MDFFSSSGRPRGDVFAVLVASSFGKLFLILNVLWHFDMHFYALVEVFTLFSNVVALEGTSVFCC